METFILILEDENNTGTQANFEVEKNKKLLLLKQHFQSEFEITNMKRLHSFFRYKFIRQNNIKSGNLP